MQRKIEYKAKGLGLVPVYGNWVPTFPDRLSHKEFKEEVLMDSKVKQAFNNFIRKNDFIMRRLATGASELPEYICPWPYGAYKSYYEDESRKSSKPKLPIC